MTQCESNYKSGSICIEWSKPHGGDEIDEYIVELISLTNSENDIETIHHHHVKNRLLHNLTIDKLQPGEKMQITVIAKNTAGSGKKKSVTYATGT